MVIDFLSSPSFKRKSSIWLTRHLQQCKRVLMSLLTFFSCERLKITKNRVELSFISLLVTCKGGTVAFCPLPGDSRSYQRPQLERCRNAHGSDHTCDIWLPMMKTHRETYIQGHIQLFTMSKDTVFAPSISILKFWRLTDISSGLQAIWFILISI